MTLNAGALCTSLMASELFGHERGSFTGATSRHHGVFEQAHKGTLFIDEIAELPLDLQAWLLRVLETGEVRALGSERVRHVNVRVITTTNTNLEELVRARRFRADLYWRLAVLTVRTPALRDRPDDLKTLSEHFLASFRLDEARRLGADAIQALALHGWPGNVRELRAVLLRAVASSTGSTLTATDIVRAIDARIDAVASTHDHNLETALLVARGNLSKAAAGRPRASPPGEAKRRSLESGDSVRLPAVAERGAVAAHSSRSTHRVTRTRYMSPQNVTPSGAKVPAKSGPHASGSRVPK